MFSKIVLDMCLTADVSTRNVDVGESSVRKAFWQGKTGRSALGGGSRRAAATLELWIGCSMQLNFNKKLIAGIVVVITVLGGALTTVNLYQSKKALYSFGQEFLKNTVTELMYAARMQDSNMRLSLANESERFAATIKEQMGFWIAKRDMHEMTIVNQENGASESVKMPSLRLGNNVVAKDTELVDRILRLSGLHATVFQVLPGKLVRINTSITKEDGTRAVGTYIPSNSPVYEAVMQGETYRGRAKVLGRDFLTTYIPTKDYSGNVVAVLFVGMEVLTPHLEQMLTDISVAGHGYAFVCDSSGKLILHPENTGENLAEYAPAVWDTVRNGSSEIVTYSKDGETRVAFVEHFEPWDWHIVVTIGEKEMMLGADETLLLSGLAVGGLGLVLAVLVVLFVLRKLLRPLDELSMVTQRIAGGDLDAHFEYSGNDAIGKTVDSVHAMVGELKHRLGFAQGVLDGISLPCSVVSADNQMLFINRQKMDIMERKGDPKEYYGRTPGYFFFHDDGKETLAQKSMKQGKRLSADVPMTTVSGREFIINATCTPIYDLEKNLIGALVMWFDLTEIKEKERLIREQNARIAEAAQLADRVAEQVSSASEELSAQIEESTSGSDEQRQRTAEAATAMEQMNASVLEVARNAGGAAEIVDTAKRKAEDGARQMEEMVGIIDAVAVRSEDLRGIMSELGQQAEGIGKIMDVISDIADQTNLLALNAAIEAARAGDAGRGFAVVADEVRKLAEKTMSATREVGTYIESIQTSAKRSIDSTDEAVEAVRDTTVRASESGKSLSEIVSMVQSGADQVRAIATAAEEQSAASEQINRSTEEINAIAAENADAMSQSAQAVSELAALAIELKEITSNMRQ